MKSMMKKIVTAIIASDFLDTCPNVTFGMGSRLAIVVTTDTTRIPRAASRSQRILAAAFIKRAAPFINGDVAQR